MGCANTKSAVMDTPKWGTARNSVSPDDPRSPTSEPIKYPASEAFIISLDDNGDIEQLDAAENNERLVLATPALGKKLPKRLQQLMEQASTGPELPVTLELVEEKLNRAELRRKELIQQRIDNIQRTTPMLTQNFRNQPDDDSNTNANANVDDNNFDNDDVDKDNDNDNDNDDDDDDENKKNKIK